MPYQIPKDTSVEISKPAQNLEKQIYNQSSFRAMPLYTNCMSWNPNEGQIPQSFSKDVSFKSQFPRQDAKHVGFQLLPDQGSSSTTQSIGQSQDRCNSSESGDDEVCAKGVEGQMKPVSLRSNVDLILNPSQFGYGNMVGQVPYPYADPYFGGFLGAYGPQAMPQMFGIAPTRVPLPVDLAEDGPIYVNAKQYHGILRRRQSRAKLEAQNKLHKARKPYLHESRHLHALNRVRGSGGRFLSSKELKQSDQNPRSSSFHHVSDSPNLDQKNTQSHHPGSNEFITTVAAQSDTSVPNSNQIFWQPERRFSEICPQMDRDMQFRGGLIHAGTQHCASVVR